MTSSAALDRAAAALQAVGELAGVDWGSVGGNEALETAVTLARVKSLVDGALVGVAGRLEATGAADAVGWASAKDLLTHLTGGRKGSGAAYTRVAKQTQDLPDVRGALTAGEVSLAQAGVIAGRTGRLPRLPELRQAAAGAMLGLVASDGLDATDLDRAFTGVVKGLDPDGSLLGSDLDKEKQERGAHLDRFLSLTNDGLGGAWIKGYGTVEDAELIKTVLMPLSAPVTTEPGACGGIPRPRTNLDPETGRPLRRGSCPDDGCHHDGRDPRDHGARLWDSLVEACHRLQDTDQVPHAHSTTSRITVTMRLEDLMTKLDSRVEGEGLLGSGDALSAAAVRRLACDADIIPAVLGGESQILDVGRTARLVTVGIWNALVLRDQHCAFPGCSRLPIACDAHHIVHWADGGPTSLDNLVLLCRKHHTVIHRTPWRVHIDPTTRRPVWTPPPPAADHGQWSYSPPKPRPDRWPLPQPDVA